MSGWKQSSRRNPVCTIPGFPLVNGNARRKTAAGQATTTTCL